MIVRSEKVIETRELSPQETAFIDAITDPSFPTVAEAGVKAGYSEEYAYKLHIKPHIQAAIRERMDHVRRANDRMAVAVTHRVGRRALEHDDELGVQYAKVFLQAVGEIQSGTRIVNNVTATAEVRDPLEDRIKRIADAIPEDA